MSLTWRPCRAWARRRSPRCGTRPGSRRASGRWCAAGAAAFFSGEPVHDLLAEPARLVESGAIQPVADTVCPLARIAEAHRAPKTGGVRGKLVVEIG
ncbi:zinc-binding dehydrogenase [Nonomuraea sp. B1E8]|uniref:zinc-binding dehydrogenase n=1 Tax=unclassified Nonomuraea TaxID=2593643 RepID=UPI00325EDF6A